MPSLSPIRTVCVLLAALGTGISVVQAAPASHCAADEEVVFSCRLQKSAKLVSLCASKNLLNKPQDGRLTYRFGKPGAVELVFPQQTAASPQQFLLFHYFRPGLDTTEVSFANNGFSYALYQHFEAESGGRNMQESGVRVASTDAAPNGTDITLSCTPATVIAHWNLIDGAVPCDEGELNTCQNNEEP